MNINEDGHWPHGWYGLDGDRCIKRDTPTLFSLKTIVFNESSIARVVVALTLTLGVNGPLVFCKPYSDPVCAVCCSRIKFVSTCRFHWLMKTGLQIIICANTSRSGIC